MLAVTGARLNEAALADVTHRLLGTLPHAAIAAVSADGFFVPMPAAVPLLGQTVMHGHASALELVVPADLRLVAEAWHDAHVHGTAQVEVRPLGFEDSTMEIHYVDARATYGVFLCFLDGDVQQIADRSGDVGAMRPRVSVVRKDVRAVFTAVDEAAVRILGHPDLVGRRNADLIHPDDAPRAIATWMDMLASPGESRRVRLRQRHRDGHWVWFEITNHNRLNDPAERCVVAEMVDISEEMTAHEFLRLQEQLLRRLTDALPVGVAQIDESGLIVHRNRRLTEIVGNPDATTVEQLFASVATDQQAELADAIAAAQSGADRDLEISVDEPGGYRGRCHVTLRPLDTHGAIICVDDITEQAQLRDQLHHRATYDPLTGCLNRASLLIELQRSLDDVTSRGIAVAYVDLDGFKAVNDRGGHAAGDALLTTIANCLRDGVRDNDLVGRIGGDEFIVISTAVPSAHHAVQLGERLAASLTVNVQPGIGHRAVASIGVAWVDHETARAIDAEALIALADHAMYESKAEGNGQPVLASSA